MREQDAMSIRVKRSGARSDFRTPVPRPDGVSGESSESRSPRSAARAARDSEERGIGLQKPENLLWLRPEAEPRTKQFPEPL
jgi:hypothetical protein